MSDDVEALMRRHKLLAADHARIRDCLQIETDDYAKAVYFWTAHEIFQECCALAAQIESMVLQRRPT